MWWHIHCRKRPAGLRPATNTWCVTWSRSSSANIGLCLDLLLLLRLLSNVRKMLQEKWVLLFITLQLRVYCRSGTDGRYWEDALCAFTRWQQHSFAWSDVMAAILKLWRQIEKSDTVDRCAFLRGTFLYHILSQSNWAVEVAATTTTKTSRWVARRDPFLI